MRERAGNAREYCKLAQVHSTLASLQIDHVVPAKHGGGETLENLALACIDCNLAKGTNLTGIDPTTSQITLLFNPRLQARDDHFEWRGAFLTGKTAVGRTTIEVLGINSEEQVQLRLALR